MDELILRLATGIPGFLMAIVFHEYAHAYVAHKFGDNTAEYSGRLTLNPMAHIDMMGTVIFPLVGALLGGIMFGWAKPVPVDARRFSKVRAGIFWVSFAGPLMNIILGIGCALILGILITQVPQDFFLYSSFAQILQQAVYINFIIAVFNLIPFPPLDGSKMVSSFLNYEAMRKYEDLQRFSFMFFILLLFTKAINYILLPALIFAEWLMRFFTTLMM